MLANIVLVIGPGILGKDEKPRLACIVAQDAYVRTVLLRRILLKKTFICQDLFLSAVLSGLLLPVQRANTRTLHRLMKHHDCPVGSEWLFGC